MLFWISLALALAALATLAVIVVRHWKEIRLLDPDSIKEERMRKTREQIVAQRFERLKSDALAPVKAVGKRAVLEGKKAFHAAYIKLIRLERFYKHAKAPFASVAPSVKDRVKSMLEEAKSLARDLKWADAERRFLEVLTVDNRNIDAYKGLGSIYLKQKLYPQARETFEFLSKMDKEDDACFAALGEIAEGEGDLEEAERMLKKAVELKPRRADYAVELARFYLAHDRPEDAWLPIVSATELTPKSPKYLELAIEIAMRTNRRDEARRRYDKLRLVSDDRQKLQVLKEKLDEAF